MRKIEFRNSSGGVIGRYDLDNEKSAEELFKDIKFYFEVGDVVTCVADDETEEEVVGEFTEPGKEITFEEEVKKCPACDADVEIEDKDKTFVCPECDAKGHVGDGGELTEDPEMEEESLEEEKKEDFDIVADPKKSKEAFNKNMDIDADAVSGDIAMCESMDIGEALEFLGE